MHKAPRSEREQMNTDQLGNRLLGLALEGLPSRSLQRFAGAIAGDPPLRQVLVSQRGGCYHAALMQQAASVAAAHPQVEAFEREAVYAATLLVRVPDLVRAYEEDHGRALPGAAPHAGGRARRWDFLLPPALRRLRLSDPKQAGVVYLALGGTEPVRISDLHSDRLPVVVRQAWAQVEADCPGYALPGSPPSSARDSALTTF
jgi:hypothetical protein